MSKIPPLGCASQAYSLESAQGHSPPLLVTSQGFPLLIYLGSPIFSTPLSFPLILLICPLFRHASFDVLTVCLPTVSLNRQISDL